RRHTRFSRDWSSDVCSSDLFVTLDPNFLTVAATTLPTSIGLSANTYLYQPVGTESYFGRLDYSYADKYLLGATIRRDGFSSFYQIGRASCRASVVMSVVGTT